jgi:hypothetical protein
MIPRPNCHETRKGGQDPTLGCSAIDDDDDDERAPSSKDMALPLSHIQSTNHFN